MSVNGKKRFSVIIQQKSGYTTDSGQQVINWIPFVTVFAAISTPRGREYYAQDKYNAQVDHVVEIRYIAGVKEDMRVLWGSRILNIDHIGEDKTHRRYLELNCIEVKA